MRENKQLILVWSDGEVVGVYYEQPSVMEHLVAAHRAEDEAYLNNASLEVPVGICEFLAANQVQEIAFLEVVE